MMNNNRFSPLTFDISSFEKTINNDTSKDETKDETKEESLSSMLEDKCIYNILFKCKNNSCFYDHEIDKLAIYGKYLLKNIIKSTFIRNNSIIKLIKNKYNNLKFRINICTHFFRNNNCKNKCENFILKNKKKLNYCYLLKEDKNFIFINLHIDFKIGKKMNNGCLKYSLVDIIYKKETIEEKNERKIKQLKKKNIELTDSNFPITLKIVNTENIKKIKISSFKSRLNSIPKDIPKKKDISMDIPKKENKKRVKFLNELKKEEEVIVGNSDIIKRDEYENAINSLKREIKKLKECNSTLFQIIKSPSIVTTSNRKVTSYSTARKINITDNIYYSDSSYSEEEVNYKDEDYENYADFD